MYRSNKSSKKSSHFINIYLASLLSFISYVLPTIALAENVVDDIGKPTRTQSGATRGPCQSKDKDKPFAALIPDKNPGLTVSEYPTFLFYLPPLQPEPNNTPQKHKAEFILLDDKEEEIYKTQFLLSGKSGVISISLPKYTTLPPLEIGKNYSWSFAICPKENPLMVVNGKIQRVELSANINNQLKFAKERDRANIYKQNNIWYDALATLANLRLSNPNDSSLKTEWEKFLNDLDLKTISQEPLYK